MKNGKYMEMTLIVTRRQEMKDTIGSDGWKPSGKSHIKLAEIPNEWRVEGYNWARRDEL